MTNSTLQKQLIQAGAAFAALAVIAGAFGSHLIKAKLDNVHYDIYQTAVQYQFYHAIALFVIGIGIRRINDNVAKTVFALFVIGIILFSGSLYLLSTSLIWAKERIGWFAIIAPVGGVSFVVGWAYIVVRGFKPSTSSQTANKVQEMQRRKPSSTEEKK